MYTAQFAFFNEFEGRKPPRLRKWGRSRAHQAELINYLNDSFDYGNRVLATLNEQNALDRVEDPYAGPIHRPPRYFMRKQRDWLLYGLIA